MNKDLIVKVFIFAAGAAIGSVATWKVLKTKYEQIAQEEIESVKEAFGKTVTEDEEGSTEDTEDDISEEDDEPMDLDEYENLVSKIKYKYESNEMEDDEDMNERPYVIAPEEFGDCDYITVNLTYYLDDVVTNELDKIIANVDELIGNDFASHFGEYEEDSVYVRNDKLQMDFEILKDYREFSEI